MKKNSHSFLKSLIMATTKGNKFLLENVEFYTTENLMAIRFAEMEQRIAENFQKLKELNRQIGVHLSCRTTASYVEVCRQTCNPQVFEPCGLGYEKKLPITFCESEAEKDKRLAYQIHRLRRDAALERQREANYLFACLKKRFENKLSLTVKSLPSRHMCRENFKASVRDFHERRRANNELARCIAARYATKRIEKHGVGQFARAYWPKIEKEESLQRRIPKKVQPLPKKKKEDWPALIKEYASVPFQNLKAVERVPLFDTLSESGRILIGSLMAFSLLRKLALAGRDHFCPSSVEPQMEEPQVQLGNAKPAAMKASTRVEEAMVSAERVPKSMRGFYNESASIERPTFSEFSDRWVYLGTSSWTTNQSIGMKVLKYPLLYSSLKQNLKAQAFALILQHCYYRCNLRVRFSLTSNRFQTGCVVASYLYKNGKKESDATNVYSSLHRSNVRMYAGAELEAELVIPYCFEDSSLSVLDGRDFVEVYVSVLNSLATTSSTAAQATIAVHVAVENLQVHGIRGRFENSDLPEPQMESIDAIANAVVNPSIASVVNAASTVLTTVGSDLNRDNPPVPLQPMHLIPQGCSSISLTNNVLAPVVVLRADATGQTPHFSTYDDMSLQSIIRRWGLIKTTTINSTTKGQFVSIPCIPLPDITDFPGQTSDVQGIVEANPTPLAYASSFYSKWRGEIEFKVEFVMSAFHKGKIMAAFIPGGYGRTVDLNEAKFCVNETFDISTDMERVFVCPWQWKNSFCSNRVDSLEEVPSVFKLFIINPIIAIDAVPPDVRVNIYVRAGKSFELALMRPSNFFCATDAQILPPSTQSPIPYNLETRMYITSSSGLVNSEGKHLMVLYIQNVVNGWLGFTNLRPGYIYKLTGLTRSGKKFRVRHPDKGFILYGTYDPYLSSSRAHGMIHADYNSLVAYVKEKDPVKARDLIPESYLYTVDGPWSEVGGPNNTWIEAPAGEDPPIWTEVYPHTVDGQPHEPEEEIEEEITEEGSFRAFIEEVFPEMGSEVVDLVEGTVSTSYGKRVFGEQCPDFKDGGHRYEFFGTAKNVSRFKGLPQDSAVSCILRVHPIREVKPANSALWDNRNLGGSIAARCCPFRGYRGGLRFQITVVGNPPEGSMIYVSHRHDMISPSRQPVYQPVEGVRTRFDMINTQYSSHLHILSVNQTVTVEVPYMSEREFLGLAGQDQKMTDNGSLWVWVLTPAEADIHLQISYSLADDFKCVQFLGIPICIDLSQIAKEPSASVETLPEPEMENEGASSSGVSRNPFEEGEPQVQNKQLGILKRAYNNLTAGFSAPATISEAVKQAADSHVEVVGKLSDTLKKFQEVGNLISEKFLSLFSKEEGKESPSLVDIFSNLGGASFELIMHIIYAILGGTKQVVIFAVANIFRIMFAASSFIVQNIVPFISGIWSKVTRSTQRSQTAVTVEPEMEDEDIAGYGSLLFATISAACGIKASPPKDFVSLSRGLFLTGSSVRQASFMGNFLKDNIKFAKRIFKKIMSLFGSDNRNFKLIAGVEDDRIQRWLLKAAFVLAPANESQREKPAWSAQVHELAVVGRALSIATAYGPNKNPRIASLIATEFKKIQELEIQLIHKRVYSCVRYEPFSVWFYGDPGCGKSHFMNRFCERLARDAGFKGLHHTYPIVGMVKYADGLDNQMNISVEDVLSLDIAMDPSLVPLILVGKSCASLKLNYSKVEDKDRLVNFQNLVFTSNVGYFDNITGIKDAKAFNRRRDVVIQFKFNEITKEIGQKLQQEGIELKQSVWSAELVAQVKTVCPSLLKRLEHVVAVVKNVHVDINKETIKRVANESYDKTVLNYLANKAHFYHQGEVDAYRNRYVEMQERMASVETDGLSFEEQLEKYLEMFKKFDSDNNQLSAPNLEEWIEKCKISAGKEVVPEMPDARPLFKYKCGNGIVLSPQCLHQNVNPQGLFYNYGDRTLSDMHGSSRCTVSTCMVMTDKDVFVPDPHCKWDDLDWKKKFVYDLLIRGRYISEVRAVMGMTDEEYAEAILRFPREIYDIIRVKKDDLHIPSAPILESEQSFMRSTVKIVGKFVFSLVKGVANIALKTCVLLYAIFEVIVQFFSKILTIVLGLLLIQTLLRSIFGSPEPELHPSGDFSTLKSNSRTVKARALKLLRTSEPQSEEVSEDTQFLNILDKINLNTFFISGCKENGQPMKVRCIGLVGREGIALKHYYDYFIANGIKRVTVTSRKGRCMVEYDLSELKWVWTSEESGYGIVELPKSYPVMFKDIRSQIVSETYGGHYPSKMKLLRVNFETNELIDVKVSQIKAPITVSSKYGAPGWTFTNGFEYDKGGAGTCGSLLLCPSLNSPIIGIHTSGVGGTRGYSEALVRETFKDSRTNIEFVDPELEDRDSVYALDGFYSQEGAIDRDLAPSMSPETSIRKSDIHGVFDVKTEPAPLNNFDERLVGEGDIVRIGVSKRCNPIKTFDQRDIYEACEHYKQGIFENVLPIRGNMYPLSVKEAIEGVPLKGMSESIEMSTSEGFPWKHLRPAGCSNKSWLFQYNFNNGRMDVTGINPILKQVLDEKLEQRKKGLVPCSYFTACLKDARILKEKVSERGKTRIFEMSPIDLTIVQRQFFLDYIGSFAISRFEHTIGINPDGYEWSQLARRLLEFSPMILTADYKAFGPRVSKDLLQDDFDGASEWIAKYEICPEEEKHERRLIRETIKYEVCDGLHVVKDLVFRPSSGLPSGNVETVNKNTGVNSRYIRIAFLGLARKSAPHYATLYWFNFFVLMFSNGDDLIISVKEEIIDWFNNRTLIEFFREYNLEMTDALKSGKVREYCSLEEATYLKRGFLKHPLREGEWLAPLEESSITDTANWIWKSIDTQKASLVNSEMSCRLAYTRGPEFYTEICEKIRLRWLEEDIYFKYPPWTLLDRHVWDGLPGPKYSFER
uniref:Genome polyprotein n=1 Tax=Sabaleta virus TaxID=2689359 RepID=A0A6B9KFY9_9VIRU|nr:polyprotein [Sabaleta virus]